MSDWEVWRVGESYRVPVAHGTWSGIEKQWVVLGPFHEDREIIGFEHDHYHLDPRFVSKRVWLTYTEAAGGVREIIARPLSVSTRGPESEGGWKAPVFVGYQRRRMIRMVSPEAVRSVFEAAKWMGELQECYDGHLRGTICPHRGGDLRGFAPDKNGCVTCTLHGLTWNTRTGRLVTCEEIGRREGLTA